MGGAGGAKSDAAEIQEDIFAAAIAAYAAAPGDISVALETGVAAAAGVAACCEAALGGVAAAAS